jgi:hypothetical protein
MWPDDETSHTVYILHDYVQYRKTPACVLYYLYTYCTHEACTVTPRAVKTNFTSGLHHAVNCRQFTAWCSFTAILSLFDSFILWYTGGWYRELAVCKCGLQLLPFRCTHFEFLCPTILNDDFSLVPPFPSRFSSTYRINHSSMQLISYLSPIYLYNMDMHVQLYVWTGDRAVTLDTQLPGVDVLPPQ